MAKPTPVQITNPYKARANKSADQSITDATWTAITFPNENYDTNNNFASNTYTVPMAGYYRIYFSCHIATTGGQGVSFQAQMLKNGSTFWLQYNQPYPAVTTYTAVGFNYSDLILLAAGDTLSFQAYCDTVNSSAATVLGTNGNTFCAFELAFPT